MKGMICLRMCLIAMRTMTLAIKGKRILDAHGIFCEIVGIEPALTKKGCAYALKTECASLNEVIMLFNKKGLQYGDILGGALNDIS